MTAREVLDGIKKRGHSAGCAAHDDCLRANTAGFTAAIEAVLEVHQPIDAAMSSGRHERMVKVCTGCGTDDGNWQRWPCPTVAAIEGALKEGR